jgi:hypothetical protein
MYAPNENTPVASLWLIVSLAYQSQAGRMGEGAMVGLLSVIVWGDSH